MIFVFDYSFMGEIAKNSIFGFFGFCKWNIFDFSSYILIFLAQRTTTKTEVVVLSQKSPEKLKVKQTKCDLGQANVHECM